MPSPPVVPRRLESLDALRGFDMLWIVGGREVVTALAGWTGWSAVQALAGQLRHPDWNGFSLWDLVFPLFLFLAGVAFHYSLCARRARGVGDASLVRHILLRATLLVALGVLYNVGRSFDFQHVRVASVLGRIGLAWAGAALIALRWGARGQLLWFVGLTAGYGLLLTLVAAPGEAAPSLEAGHTLCDWFDRQFLPGRLLRGDRDPEGLLSTLPAVATGLAGVLAGRVLRELPAARTRLALLVGSGALCLALAWVVQVWIPLNKNLWSSSFVLVTTGASLLLLAAFHAAIDVAGWRRVARPLSAIGSNALAAYLLWRFVDFSGAARLLLGESLSPGGKFAAALLALGLLWWLLAEFQVRRWYLRL